MDYTPEPYPRMLYKGEQYCIVNDEAEEKAKGKEGWGDAAPAPAPEADAAPAPAKRGRPAKV